MPRWPENERVVLGGGNVAGAAVVDDIPSVSVSDLYPKGAWKLFHDGTFYVQSSTLIEGRFPDGARLAITATPGDERVDYVIKVTTGTGRSITVGGRIDVSWTPLNFGGFRPRLHCPHCDREARRLFIRDSVPLCRGCTGVSYKTQRMSADARKLKRAAALRRRHGGVGHRDDPFPDRPKGVHLRTYVRDQEEALELEEDVQHTEDLRFWAAVARGDKSTATKRAILRNQRHQEHLRLLSLEIRDKTIRRLEEIRNQVERLQTEDEG
jgi:hypothetical protein